MIPYRDLTQPYDEAEYTGIAYSTCRDFEHISRYRNLRQVIHCPNSADRFVTLETTNPVTTNKLNVIYHVVEYSEENRLDLIANKYLGAPTYSWIISYFNSIEDGYTVREGQTLIIPRNVSDLFATGEILAPVAALQLNLGEE